MAQPKTPLNHTIVATKRGGDHIYAIALRSINLNTKILVNKIQVLRKPLDISI
ncbi:hypothetical protein EMIT0324P_310004 [Pseudomonas chlororaphis]